MSNINVGNLLDDLMEFVDDEVSAGGYGSPFQQAWLVAAWSEDLLTSEVHPRSAVQLIICVRDWFSSRTPDTEAARCQWEALLLAVEADIRMTDERMRANL